MVNLYDVYTRRYEVALGITVLEYIGFSDITVEENIMTNFTGISDLTFIKENLGYLSYSKISGA
jgi:hypothetical protein